MLRRCERLKRNDLTEVEQRDGKWFVVAPKATGAAKARPYARTTSPDIANPIAFIWSTLNSMQAQHPKVPLTRKDALAELIGKGVGKNTASTQWWRFKNASQTERDTRAAKAAQ